MFIMLAFLDQLLYNCFLFGIHGVNSKPALAMLANASSYIILKPKSIV